MKKILISFFVLINFYSLPVEGRLKTLNIQTPQDNFILNIPELFCFYEEGNESSILNPFVEDNYITEISLALTHYNYLDILKKTYEDLFLNVPMKIKPVFLHSVISCSGLGLYMAGDNQISSVGQFTIIDYTKENSSKIKNSSARYVKNELEELILKMSKSKESFSTFMNKNFSIDNFKLQEIQLIESMSAAANWDNCSIMFVRSAPGIDSFTASCFYESGSAFQIQYTYKQSNDENVHNAILDILRMILNNIS
ncbi:hypothetical protein N9I63_01405 [Hyphomicrobiales bacterium]|nr:hypothetical protein [Hyphomicrobiales bacterium]